MNILPRKGWSCATSGSGRVPAGVVPVHENVLELNRSRHDLIKHKSQVEPLLRVHDVIVASERFRKI